MSPFTLDGMEFRRGIPEGWTLLEAVVVAKAIDEDGDVALAFRYSAGLSSWEAVGLLRAGEAVTLDEIVNGATEESE